MDRPDRPRPTASKVFAWIQGKVRGLAVAWTLGFVILGAVTLPKCGLKMCPEIVARSPGCKERESRKPEHTWTYVRIFGGTRDAADWARSRFLDTS